MKIFWKILLVLLILVWMGFIYFLSSVPGQESNIKSKAMIQKAIEKEVGKKEVTEEEHQKQVQKLVNKINAPLRKVVHAVVYIILAILIGVACKVYGSKKWMYISFPIVLSFLYACTDEIHQRYVVGRSGKVSDVVIDTCGAIIGLVILQVCIVIKNKIKEQKGTLCNTD